VDTAKRKTIFVGFITGFADIAKPLIQLLEQKWALKCSPKTNRPLFLQAVALYGTYPELLGSVGNSSSIRT
jgi:hypothetical protein